MEDIVLRPGDVVTVMQQKKISHSGKGQNYKSIDPASFTTITQELFLVIKNLCPHCLINSNPELPEEFREMDYPHENRWEGLQNEKIVERVFPTDTHGMLSNYTIDVFNPETKLTITYYGTRIKDDMSKVPMDWRMDVEDHKTGNYYTAKDVKDMSEAKEKAPYLSFLKRFYGKTMVDKCQ